MNRRDFFQVTAASMAAAAVGDVPVFTEAVASNEFVPMGFLTTDQIDELVKVTMPNYKRHTWTDIANMTIEPTERFEDIAWDSFKFYKAEDLDWED